MNNFRVIHSGFDVGPLLHQILANPQLWNTNTARTSKPYTVHYDVDDIILRYNTAGTDNWNYLAFNVLSAAQPIVFGIAAAIRMETLGRVLISRLPPGAKIPWHQDLDPRGGRLFFDRYQVPIQAAPGVKFRCNGETIEMQPGKAYWFRNSAYHEILNTSAMDRISMVIDARPFTPYEAS